MDDFPAGPASPEPRRPPLSVVIPVHNGGRDFERCLRELRDSSFQDFELVVVDDGSNDGSAALAQRFGARVLRNETPQGPAAARNSGARAAIAPLVFFLDADVAVHHDTIRRALDRFQANPKLTALFGSYDDCPPAPGLVSRFRNLLHHYVHQTGRFEDDVRPAHSFWTGCGMIRRRAFIELGGFDPRLYPRPAIEDIELGYRLARAGHKVILARDVQAAHLKCWSLKEMVLTDIFRRGVPWVLLLKRTRMDETDLNVGWSQRLSVASTGAGLLGLSASVLFPWAAAVWVLGFVAFLLLNRGFHRFLGRRKGAIFMIGSIPLHYLYFCCCGVSVLIAWWLWHAKYRRAWETGRDGAVAIPPPHLPSLRSPRATSMDVLAEQPDANGNSDRSRRDR